MSGISLEHLFYPPQTTTAKAMYPSPSLITRGYKGAKNMQTYPADQRRVTDWVFCAAYMAINVSHCRVHIAGLLFAGCITISPSASSLSQKLSL